ncbi:hypothetical protein BU17DRAFT_88654 [Hysterangium stoloniferum]|nr:hypothetical protein BU17DRAFT_88654 [Hysterangium stoloniferum]
MPRTRRVAYSDEDSQKENQGSSTHMSTTKVKAEKGATARASRAKFAHANLRIEDDDEQRGSSNVNPKGKGRRADTEILDEENLEEGGGDDEDGAEEGSPNGRKRARLNEIGDAIAVKEEKPRIMPRVTLPRDKDGYVPGSVVRVQLKNFVTYDFVEFRPGPNLNMIFGPNGTGKSSIACALCIGLNGTPSLLGRSSELNSFVKHGHENGYVEIELKGKIGTPNLVIRRSINSKNRSSQFTLNGSNSTGREINERLAELNVQVGNLCSFLPQDRVSEFAQMTPQQLLKETQRTAGDANLTAWHNTLIEKGADLKKSSKGLQEEQQHILQLEEKQKTLEKDVKRFQERQTIERQIELLELVLPYVEYRESKAIYDEAKIARDQAAIEYRRLEEENRPLKELQVELGERHSQLDQQRKLLKERIRNNYKATVDSIMKRNKQATGRAEDALERIKTIKRQEKDLAKNKAKTRDEIKRLQEKVDNPPELEPLDPLLAESKSIKETVAELKIKKAKVAADIGSLVDQITEKERSIAEQRNELKQIDDIMIRKLQSLHNWDKDCAAVAHWFIKNKDTNDFAKRVELPAMLTLTVPDGRFANAVEACFNANQMKTFVTHSEDDYNQFSRMFIDTPEGLGYKARVTVWFRPENQASLAGSPLSHDELRDLGFDGHAIDFVDCPEGLIWFLTKELNMHRTPVALRNVDDARIQAALGRTDPSGRSGGNYISGTTVAMVSRSAYGQQKTMTVTRSIRPAKNFGPSPIDANLKKAINDRIAELQRAHEMLQAEINTFQRDDHELIAHLESWKPKHLDVLARIDNIRRGESEIRANRSKLETLGRRLQDFDNRGTSEEERKRQKVIVDKTVKERSGILAELVTLVKDTIAEQSELAVISLKQVQLAADVQAIDTLCNDRSAEARRVKQAYDEANERFDVAKRDSKEKVATTRAKLNAADDELQQTFKDLEQQDQQKSPEERWTSDKVAVALETEHAKLELNHATDAGVIETYEARRREIESLQKSFEKKEEKHKKLEEKIKKTRDLWYPALTGLVAAVGEKFSEAFDRIKCAGEIRIAENEDYDKWSIDIFVKFRDEEPLTQLTAQRQSGGERSLTTIMYLMSLTEHARAPFSLGMDQSYERAVHNQLVEVTCKPESGQYFLITPKLLPSLRYHKSMKILCVNNGEWLPEATSAGVGNMRKMIESYVARNRPGPGPSAD